MYTVQELRDKGCKVRVHHYRVMNDVGVWDEERNEFDNVHTRKQYNALLKEGKIRDWASFHDKFLNEENGKFGNFVSPAKGFTQIEITTPDGRNFHGKYNHSGNFNKKNGVIAAIGRALKGSTID